MGRPGRPRKPDDEKLHPLSVGVTPEVYAVLRRIATRRRMKVSEVARQILTGRIRTCEPAEFRN